MYFLINCKGDPIHKTVVTVTSNTKNAKAQKGARKVPATTSKPKQPFTITEEHTSLFTCEKEDINIIL